MLLCVDIGNTNIDFGIFDGSYNDLIYSFTISSESKRSPDEYFLIVNQMLSLASADISVDQVCISSVVPSLTADITKACKKLSNKEPFLISKGTKTGFPIKIDTASQLGADIVSNTAAAFNLTKAPFIVVDIGTATTLTIVNNFGQLIGAVIAPGVSMSLEALENSCALLYNVSFSNPDTIIGKNSQDSIKSGIFWGHVFMIDGFIDKMCETLCKDGSELSLIGTGGLADVILPNCRNKFDIIPGLTLKGAASLFYLNTQSRPNYTK